MSKKAAKHVLSEARASISAGAHLAPVLVGVYHGQFFVTLDLLGALSSSGVDQFIAGACSQLACPGIESLIECPGASKHARKRGDASMQGAFTQQSGATACTYY
eukprot:CAMPEP_0119115672 /NCGR_PEP_ID=MMETSP1180-20130426/51793_1 /TAXON_ID=3052 ORGANISM="Chlamydomonas cf sp, Strain CCMP681" /NCGR_SAMPLE_ID=MMETSP1180 /ASSEMBLY_ACC=CAM_ASM_000741 /LENGTH=103 /DNA_ID=CAMNT_0007104753 /DNA_START=679 /DNA_END=990 /DNA_ORIENTATION=-